MELIASLLILIPATTFLGALLGTGLMTGAIIAHLGKLGISVQNDGGLLFIYASLVFISSAVLLYIYRDDFFLFTRKIFGKQ